MPLGAYPKDALLDKRGMLVRTWDVWVNKLQNIIDFGNPPSGITNITATGGIGITNPIMRIQSATAGNTTITVNPQISKGYDGERLTVEGLDNVKTVTISNGLGVALKSGPTFVVGEDDILELIFNRQKDLWIETSNNN